MRNGYSLCWLALVSLLQACSSGGEPSTSSAPPPLPNQQPAAQFAAAPGNGLAPLTVAFDAGGSSDLDGQIVAYQWDFGDGATGGGESINHTYLQDGTFTAMLTVRDDSGGSATATRVIAVDPAFALSGRIAAASGSVTDSDVNDPFAPFQPNDTAAQAQDLPNPAIVGGFSSETGTGGNIDRFADIGDPLDVFRVELSADQSICLNISDWPSADLDLLLLDPNTIDIVADSLGVGPTEAVTAPASGTYLVVVAAFSGISNYIMNLGAGIVCPVDPRSRLSTDDDFVPDELIARFLEPRHAAANSSAAADVVSAHGLEITAGVVEGPRLLRATPAASAQAVIGDTHFTRFAAAGLDWSGERADKYRTITRLKSLRADQSVHSADLNYRARPLAMPSDEFFDLQWHYTLLNLPQAWDVTTGTPATGEVIVAVVDTGVFLEHTDLVGKLTATGYDFISDAARAGDGDGIDANPDDPGDDGLPGGSSWHGTHVAGTVGASTDNGVGVAGVSWGARIMPIRVLGLGGGTSFDILQGVRYAAGLSNDSGTSPAESAAIINLSLGRSGGFSQTEQDVYTEVRGQGVIVIAAAGNDGSSAPSYPASYNGVVSVSAVNQLKGMTFYSNFGPFIDVAAPGGDLSNDQDGNGFIDGVFSTFVDEGATRQSAFTFQAGTSMAAPHVAGIAALMKAVHPQLTPDEFDALLVGGQLTDDLGDPGRDDFYGYGLINAIKAVRAAEATAAGQPVPETLLVAPPALDFGLFLVDLPLDVTSVGGTLTVTGVTTDRPWLSVAPEPGLVDVNGLGRYRVVLDRAALDVGVFAATVTIAAGDGSALTVPAFIRQSAATPGDTGYLYIALFDVDTGENKGQLTMTAVDGHYDYALTRIAAGTYELLAGTDLDNDGIICDAGEACGAYPSLDLASNDPLVVDRDLSGLDFVTTFVDSLSATAMIDAPSVQRSYRIRKPSTEPKRLDAAVSRH